MKINFVRIGLATMVLMCGTAYAEPSEKKSPDWLTGAGSDAERFELLQKYLRGFDQPMWEVGERFRSIHEALSRDNYELAAYHWEKIRITIQNGYLKRPARKANAEAILLNSTWAEVKAAFDTKHADTAWAGFEKARHACMTCHTAESVPYMSNQPLFDLARPAAKPQ